MCSIKQILPSPSSWLIHRVLSDRKEFIHHKGFVILESGFDGFKQIRDPLFVEKTKAALDFIADTDPLRFKRVQRFIKIIARSNRGLASYNQKFNSCSVGFAHFHFEDDAPYKIPWYARTLIHEATHGVFHHRKIPYTKRTREKIEYFCVLEEWRFTQRFGDDGYDWYDHVWSRIINRAWDSVWNESPIHRAKTIFKANANGELETNKQEHNNGIHNVQEKAAKID
jgi:hypothetical protein